MIKIVKHSIRGVDWQELIPPILQEEDDDDKEEEQRTRLVERIRLVQSNLHGVNRGVPLKNADQYVVKVLREYVLKLSINTTTHLCCSPIYKGLNEIGDTETFLKYSTLLLEHTSFSW